MAKGKFSKGSYSARGGGPRKKGSPLGGAQRETSIGAARQKRGLPYFPQPPAGFGGPPPGGRG